MELLLSTFWLFPPLKILLPLTYLSGVKRVGPGYTDLEDMPFLTQIRSLIVLLLVRLLSY